MFGFMVLLVTGGMAALAFLITSVFGGDGSTAVIVWIGGLGLAVAFPIMAVGMAVRAFRRVATPLADVMAAAEAIASGDLSARVDERGSGEFNRLASSFNRMIEELERTDKLRRNLTADVAHELRTPLHIIQGNLEGVQDGVYEPTAEHIDATLHETRVLARLVEDLNTLSLAESGQLPLEIEVTDLADLLDDLKTGFGGQAEEAGVQLWVSTDVASAPTVMADAGRVHQILSNLMANALRHTTRDGLVTLSAFSEGATAKISVSDSGEGISEEDLPFVFDRFWRGDPSRPRDGGSGGGLGLAIARQLAIAHGGAISVESELGVGATFTVELPTGGPRRSDT